MVLHPCSLAAVVAVRRWHSILIISGIVKSFNEIDLDFETLGMISNKREILDSNKYSF
jgi:hypothetical protein